MAVGSRREEQKASKKEEEKEEERIQGRGGGGRAMGWRDIVICAMVVLGGTPI